MFVIGVAIGKALAFNHPVGNRIILNLKRASIADFIWQRMPMTDGLKAETKTADTMLFM